MEKTFSLDNVTIIYLKERKRLNAMYVLVYAQKNTCIAKKVGHLAIYKRLMHCYMSLGTFF